MGDLKCLALICDTKKSALDTEYETIQSARAGGWHVWSGVTLGGEFSWMVLCPAHSRGGGAKGSSDQVPQQESLW